LTEVKGLFGLLGFRIAAVFDAFSRMPLALRVFVSEPTAGDLVRFVARAVRRHGKPRVLVSDRGGHFTAHDFQRALDALGIPHRLGAVGIKGSISLLGD
jgi:transposase InsO family protein